MSGSSDLPPRPAPPRRLGDLAGAWLAWFGLGRLIAAACCTLIVGGGAFWLVRSPTPPAEARLPVTSTASAASQPAVTLPPPIGQPRGDDGGQIERVVVHVAGAVASPGVYELAVDSRVHDAVAAAGGAAAGADLEGLNLAARLVDGGRVYVPVIGEIDPAAVPTGVPGEGVDVATGPLDLNRATADQFEQLPGVGPATAAAIVDDRDRNGPFASVDDLDRVPGIGPAKLAALRQLVSV